MPFNETNDYTSSQWQEKSDTSQITSSPPSCSQSCCRVDGPAGWANQAAMGSGSQRWGLPSAETSWPHALLYVQWVTDFGSHLWACSKRCLPQVLGEQGRSKDVRGRHGNVFLLRCVIAREVLVAAKSQKNLIIKMECLFLLDTLLSPIRCILFLLSAVFLLSLCLLLMSSSL